MEQDKVILPGWYKDDLRKTFKADTSHAFILYGNMNDLFANPSEATQTEKPFIPLLEFLELALSAYDLPIFFNIADGFTFPDDEMEKLFWQTVGADPAKQKTILRDPVACFELIELALKKVPRSSVVISPLSALTPNSGGMTPYAERVCAEKIKRWAVDETIKANGTIIIMIANQLTEIANDLRENAVGVEPVIIEVPNISEREEFIHSLSTVSKKSGAPVPDNFDAHAAAIASQGLGLRQIQTVFSLCASTGVPVTADEIMKRKMELLNEQYGDVIEFAKADICFDDIGGLDGIKADLRQAIDDMRAGLLEDVPQGIMLFGPPGTGKTLLAEATANYAHFPCLIQKNPRTKWQGEAEQKKEKQLYGIRSHVPCIVINDEADLNDAGRDANENDGGVSQRLMQAQMTFLSDPRIKGRVLFINMTNRPDRIDAALKRDGRADARYAVTMPNKEARAKIFAICFRKLKIKSDITDFSEFADKTNGKSGANINAICQLAKKRAKKMKHEKVLTEDLLHGIAIHIGSASQDENDLMTLLALTETSSSEALPGDTEELIIDIAKRGIAPNLAVHLGRLIEQKIISADVLRKALEPKQRDKPTADATDTASGGHDEKA